MKTLPKGRPTVVVCPMADSLSEVQQALFSSFVENAESLKVEEAESIEHVPASHAEKPLGFIVFSGGDATTEFERLTRWRRDRGQTIAGAVVCQTGEIIGFTFGPLDCSNPEESGKALAKRFLRAAKRRLRSPLETLRIKIKKLQRLAIEDPLTGLLNRRGFEKFLQIEWSRSKRYDSPLACVVVDIDDFKGINDTYGHARGDHALRTFGQVLRDACRDSDVTGRIGGEEFAILLPNCTPQMAVDWSERTRQAVAATLIETQGRSFRLTASFGVSGRDIALRDPSELLDHADRALFSAKQAGKNRVYCHGLEVSPKKRRRDLHHTNPVLQALFDSIELRDVNIANHCRRVSNLSGQFARQIGLSENDVWTAETAGLLHDIGKIGVPDAILQKDSRLNDNERAMLRMALESSHDIVKSAFGEGPLACAVRTCRIWHKDNADVSRREYPLSGRIVAIADAYISMTTPAPYRKELSPVDAISELKRCAGAQFDEHLVAQFESMVIKGT